MEKYKCKSGSPEALHCYRNEQGDGCTHVFSVVYIDNRHGRNGSVQLDLNDVLKLRAQLDEFVRIEQPLWPAS